MELENRQSLFSVAQWVDDGNRRLCKMIRQLAQTEENYLIIIREIDRVREQGINSRKRGAQATLTMVEWLTILETFGWQCAYCQSKPFQVMHHVIPLPKGGTVAENCVPACYRCSHFFHRGSEKSEQYERLRRELSRATRCDGRLQTLGTTHTACSFPEAEKQG